MPTIETIISPAIFHLYEEEIHHKNVVVIDILRATTTMCTAFKNGATEILPVAKPEDAAALQKMGWIAAAERHGETVPGFDLGNSPQDFTKESVYGKKIAITTTNGTRALQMCESAKAVFVGSFLNLSQLTNELQHRGDDLLLFCAGWKDKFNLEDTLFAGAVATELSAEFDIFDDATLAAIDLYNSAKNDLNKYLQKASHVKRFKSLHIESDLDVCLKIDSAPVLPVFKNGVIVQMNNEQTA
jgi:2-phosphosulfolactate phosphatase